MWDQSSGSSKLTTVMLFTLFVMLIAVLIQGQSNRQALRDIQEKMTSSSNQALAPAPAPVLPLGELGTPGEVPVAPEATAVPSTPPTSPEEAQRMLEETRPGTAPPAPQGQPSASSPAPQQ